MTARSLVEKQLSDAESAVVFGKKSNLVSKVQKYKWEMQDSPGVLKMIDKSELRIDHTYQREAIQSKVIEFASNWSWIACGVIIVAIRDGEYWVIDGQHRVIAANRRADIIDLPCILFKTESVKQEAVGFLSGNSNRKPITAISKFKALTVSEDEAACFVQAVFDDLGLVPRATAMKPGEIKMVALCIKHASENKEKFRSILTLCSELSRDEIIKEKLFSGLWYIDDRLEGGIFSERFLKRIRQIGGMRLVDAATRAAAYFKRGGAGVWADGMIDEINKGLQKKFSIRD